jgi:transglutaminase-like putative cysteine protease
MTRYAVRHETRYAYTTAVDIGFHVLRLTPLALPWQRALSHTLAITPQPTHLRAFADHFGNQVHHVNIETTHDGFSVTLDATVEVTDRKGLPETSPAWESVRDAMRMDGFPVPPEVAEFCFPSPLASTDKRATAYAAESFAEARPIVGALRELTTRIKRDFAYAPESTDISTRVWLVMDTRQGVCQDFAHVMIAGLRGLGLPARYVSGYIRTRSSEEALLIGGDASHAWVSVWCGPEIGWVDFDPTNDLLVGTEHVAVAYGRDFSDVTPLRGVILGGGSHTLKVGVSVIELDRRADAGAA